MAVIGLSRSVNAPAPGAPQRQHQPVLEERLQLAGPRARARPCVRRPVGDAAGSRRSAPCADPVGRRLARGRSPGRSAAPTTLYWRNLKRPAAARRAGPGCCRGAGATRAVTPGAGRRGRDGPDARSRSPARRPRPSEISGSNGVDLALEPGAAARPAKSTITRTTLGLLAMRSVGRGQLGRARAARAGAPGGPRRPGPASARSEVVRERCHGPTLHERRPRRQGPCAPGVCRPGPPRYPGRHARGRRAHRPDAARPPGPSWAPPPLGGACRHPCPDAPDTESLEDPFVRRTSP